MAVVSGNTHHDNPDKGSPVKIGGKASTSAPTDVANGDRTDAYFDAKGRLVVWAQSSAGSDLGGGTQYTEGDTDTTITGTAAMWEDGSDTLRAVSAAKPLPVNVVSGAAAGAEYTEGDTDASITGPAIMWEDGSDTLRAVSAAKPLPVSGTVAATQSGTWDEVGIHDSGNSITVDGTLAVTQSGTWDEVGINDSGNSITVDNPIISVVGTGTEAAAQRVTIATDSTGVLSVDDNGSSLTVDGTVAVTQSGTWDEVGIHDSGNSITVDGTVTANLAAGTNNIGDVDILTIAAGDNNIGNVDIASIAAGDNNIGNVDVVTLPALVAGSANIGDVDVLTLPAIPAGNNNIGDVDVATIAAGDNNIGNVDIVTLPGVGGLAAHAAATSGNPVYVAGRASAALPTDVGADADAAGLWTTRHGAQVVAQAPHLTMMGSPYTLTSKTVQVTTAQTGTDVWSPASGKFIVVTSVQIQAFSTTAGTCILWFGLTADTTYSRGTDLAIFDGEFAPSATLKPGWSAQGLWIGPAADSELHLTSVGDIDLTVTVWGYEV